MDVSSMGLPPGVTPFDSTPPIIEFTASICRGLPQMLCTTADTFARVDTRSAATWSTWKPSRSRVFVSKRTRASLCVWYITDGADSDSANTHWEAALDNEARAFYSLSISPSR